MDRKTAIRIAASKAQEKVRQYMSRWKPPEERVLVVNDPVYGRYLVVSPHVKKMLDAHLDASPLRRLTMAGMTTIYEDRYQARPQPADSSQGEWRWKPLLFVTNARQALKG